MRKGILTFLLAGLLAGILFHRPARGAVVVTDLAIVSESCGAAGDKNNAPDPNEKISLAVTFKNNGPDPVTYATASLVTNDNIIPFAKDEVLGKMPVGASITHTFDFVVRGACGDMVNLAVDLRDGDTDLGRPAMNVHLGVPNQHNQNSLQAESIAIPSSGLATPYPSEITVSGMPGTIDLVRIELRLTHTNPDDVDILLVAPDGQKFVLMSDAGGSTDATDVGLMFMAGEGALPDDGPLVSGMYAPTSCGGPDVFDAPAPPGPYSTNLRTLQGIDPNGTWKLFVVDDSGGYSGHIDGWGLLLRTVTYECCSSTPQPDITPVDTVVLAENCPPANGVPDPNETVSLRFRYRNLGTGDVAALSSEVVPGPGVQPLSGVQSAGPLKVASSGMMTHQVILRAPAGATVPVLLKMRDGATDLGNVAFPVTLGTQAGHLAGRFEWRDPSRIAVPASGAALPYPATIRVSNVAGAVVGISVQLEGLTHPHPEDLSVLLVGPTGQTVLLMADAGGSSPVDNASLIFWDGAENPLPDDGPITSGGYRPTNHAGDDEFLLPAPREPYGTALSGFHGLPLNGIWSLYVIDDAMNNAGSLSGWGLNLITEGKTYTYAAGPTAIPDRNTLDAGIPVFELGYVSSLEVRVRADHPNDADLRMALVSPDGTEVPLVRNRGGSGDNFGYGVNDCTSTGTIFKDSAEGSIATAPAPFNSAYRPESPLSGLMGHPTFGVWKLRISDGVAGNTGTLGCWKLMLDRTPSMETVQASATVIPQVREATPYPSTVTVAGARGRVVGVSVRLNGLTHTRPDDLDMMLIGPEGQACMLMSDAGGENPVSNLDMIFDPSVSGALPDEGQIVAGVYRPVNYDTSVPASADQFPPPAPSGAIPADLGIFRGADPNGEWKLCVVDDFIGESGSLAGWTLTLHTDEFDACSGMPFTAPDLAWAMKIIGGMIEGSPATVDRLDVTGNGRLDLRDAPRLLRKILGTED